MLSFGNTHEQLEREREEFHCKMVNHYCLCLPLSIWTHNLVISRFNCFLTLRIKQPALLSTPRAISAPVAKVNWVHFGTISHLFPSDEVSTPGCLRTEHTSRPHFLSALYSRQFWDNHIQFFYFGSYYLY